MESRKRVVAVQGRERMLRALQNRKEGQAFLEQNEKRGDVVTLPSGLQYRIVEEGTGPHPGPSDMVAVHYRGTLIDGTEFDSSYGRGGPAEFRVNEVISGWTDALQLMKEGARWELFIPPDLAYGIEGSGSSVGPDSQLIFEVHLLAVTGT